jgi:hypothetical protein
MLKMKIHTLNNIYEVEEDDSGNRRVTSSTHPSESMRKAFINQKVTHLKEKDCMYVSNGARTSLVQSIETIE